MEDCIFCKIISSNSMMKVYEDDWTVAFMDVAKDVDGHILVVPKKHVKNILDCDVDTLRKVMDTVKGYQIIWQTSVDTKVLIY